MINAREIKHNCQTLFEVQRDTAIYRSMYRHVVLAVCRKEAELHIANPFLWTVVVAPEVEMTQVARLESLETTDDFIDLRFSEPKAQPIPTSLEILNTRVHFHMFAVETVLSTNLGIEAWDKEPCESDREWRYAND